MIQSSMALALQASQVEVLWIINIYAITLSALLLPQDALGDRIGRKPTLLAGRPGDPCSDCGAPPSQKPQRDVMNFEDLRLGHVDDFRSRNVRHCRCGRSAEKGSSIFP
jgi:hypothetical protein